MTGVRKEESMCYNSKVLFAGLLLVALARSLFADVQYEEVTTMNLPGGFGTSETYSKVFIKGDMKREETTTKMTMEIPGMPEGIPGMSEEGQELKEITIIRLDKGLQWEIELHEGTYSETKFADLKQMAVEDEMADDEIFEMPEFKTEFDIKKTGATKVINGYKCEQTIITITIKEKDPETGKEASHKIINDMWLSPGIKGRDELDAFNEKYERMTGFSKDILQNLGQTSRQQYQFAEELLEEMKNIKGFPILMNLKMIYEGAGEQGSIQSDVKVETKSVSTKPIDASIFELPKELKKVEH